MLRWRLLLGSLLIAALVTLCWLDHHATLPGPYLFPLALLATILGSSEIIYMMRAGGMHPLPWVVYTGNILLLVSNWVAPLLAHSTRAASATRVGTVADDQWPLLALGIGVLLAFLGEMQRYEKPGGVVINLASAIFALAYVGVLLSFVVQLRMLWGIGALASLVVVVKMGDTGAYTVGRLIGRHKMAPVLSPGKTIEGLVGHLVFACVGSWLAFTWLVPQTLADPAAFANRWWGWLTFGLLVGTTGLLGDLAESLIKRDVGCKDSSNWLPGFGGTLDILDSILLAAPVAWFCWACGLVGH